MKGLMYLCWLMVVLVAIELLVPAANVDAHGRTTVGDYQLVIGFANEPAFEDQPNGLSLRVTNTTTGEPVTGLEESLQVMIIYGASQRVLRLEPAFGEEGLYTAHVIPSEPGDYTWHIYGTIEDTPVEVSMTSSPDTFSSVDAQTDYAFPGAENAAAQPGLNADRQMGLIGMIAGIAGLILGAAALVVSLTANRAARQREAAPVKPAVEP